MTMVVDIGAQPVYALVPECVLPARGDVRSDLFNKRYGKCKRLVELADYTVISYAFE